MSSNSNNINYKDFKNICRICLINCDVKFPQDNVISNIFFKLTDIHFETNNELPQQICQKCFETINEFHGFASRCIQTHFILIKCLNNYKSSGINEKQNEVTDNLEIKQQQDIQLEEEIIPETSEINSDDNIDFNEVLLIPFTANIEGERSYNCDQCSKTFDQLSKLNSHMRTHKHSGERPYKCDICAKTFARRFNFKYHMRTHSGERPFKCNQCEKSFFQASHLKGHLLTHSSERPHKCDECAKSFQMASSLKVHMRKHSGERPYTCEYCAKTFAQSQHWLYHKRTHCRKRPNK